MYILNGENLILRLHAKLSYSYNFLMLLLRTFAERFRKSCRFANQ